MNVLIVEDEKYTLEEIAEYIKEYNPKIHCIACQDPIEAWELVSLNKVDIAFLDIEMPRMNGLDLAHKISHINPETKIVFITAYNNHAAEAFEVSASDYLLKPLRKEKLFNTLKKLTADYNLHGSSENIMIKTFGKLVIANDKEVLKWKRQKSAELFAFLLFHKEKAIHKDVICDTIWPTHEPSKALVNLQTVMYQLRKSLTEICKDEICIEYANHSYRLLLGESWVDADAFEKVYERALSIKEKDEDALLEAYQLYQGGYLEEEGWIWALPMQQRLELKYRKVLEELVELSRQKKESDKLLEYAEKICSLIYDEEEIQKYFLIVSGILGKEKALKWRERIKL